MGRTRLTKQRCTDRMTQFMQTTTNGIPAPALCSGSLAFAGIAYIGVICFCAFIVSTVGRTKVLVQGHTYLDLLLADGELVEVLRTPLAQRAGHVAVMEHR